MTATLAPPKPQMRQQAKPVDPQSVVPMAGETQAAFFLRANRALQQSIPKQNNRTVAIIRAWQQSDNDRDLRDEAKGRFSPEKFTQYGPRCIFLSHTIPEIAEEVDETTGEITQPGREGTVYDQKNIQHLVDYANYRIRNAGQFAALSEGHMPTMEEKATGRPDANVLGYAGPFYIGLYGNLKPQWAIFCDEWVHNEDVAKSEKLQRRSPEVWCKEPIERRTMDPIAMLGSETPRLDSGMNLYAKRADGQEVVHCYSMSMALPGANNCYVPGSETGKPAKYGANEMVPPGANSGQPPADPTQDTGGDDQVINAVVEAVAKLMPSIVQAVQQKMQAGQAGDPDAVPSDDESGNGEQDPSQSAPRGVEQPDPEESTDDSSTQQLPPVDKNSAMSNNAGYGEGKPVHNPQAGNQQQGSFNAAPDGGTFKPVQDPVNSQGQAIDDQHVKYMAMGGSCGDAYAAGHAAGCSKGRPMTTNYAKSADVDARYKAMEERIAAQAQMIQDLQTDKRDTERYAKIHAIAQEREIGDEAEVLKDVIDVSDAEFERYCKALAKAPVKGDVLGVEIYDDPRLNPETDNYSRRNGTVNGKQVTREQVEMYSRQAADICARKKAKKVETTYEAELKTIFVANGLPDPTV